MSKKGHVLQNSERRMRTGNGERLEQPCEPSKPSKRSRRSAPQNANPRSFITMQEKQRRQDVPHHVWNCRSN
jgi:hypothetical protein